MEQDHPHHSRPDPQLEIDRLRILLERARHDLRLADERATLQRLHIAQLQSQLGLGNCREERGRLPHGSVDRWTPQAPAEPPPPAAKTAPREPIAPPDDRQATPAPRKASTAGCRISEKTIPIDPDRQAIGMCQYPPCEEEVDPKNGRYCGQSCTMRHRWAHVKQRRAADGIA